jgi:catechol 2,3-dioxygenase-like lactoylglutathione lyase family enzyme
MIQSKFGHIQFNIYPQNLTFYKDLFAYLGWTTIADSPDMLGVGSVGSESLWFLAVANQAKNDYDGPGFNHIGLQVQSQAEVDQMVAYLAEHRYPALFETPRHRPEFSMDAEHTYYQVMFESPDCILFEVVYMGPKLNP